MNNDININIKRLNLVPTSIQFHKLISTFFHKEYYASVIVRNINVKMSQITVKSGSYVFECVTNLNISEIDPGDKIIIQFKLIPKLNVFMEIQPLILFFCQRSEYENILNQYTKYNRTQLKLNNIITSNPHNILTKPLPKIIHRIGLIVLDTHTIILDIFKSEFNLKCIGELFVYKVKSSKNTKFDFINAINYFNKYHEINLICILTETLTIEHLFDLSSKYVLKNIKYNTTHTIAVTYQNGILSNSADYSTLLATNIRKLSIDKTISAIHKTQIKYQNNITNTISTGILLLEEMINSYMDSICNFESDVERLNVNGIKFIDNPVEIKNTDNDTHITNIDMDNNMDGFVEILNEDL